MQKRYQLLGIILTICLAYSSYAQYPRIGCFTWGGAPDSSYAQNDLIIIGNIKREFAEAIKALNPDIKIVSTIDWNATGHAGDEIPEKYQLKLADESNACQYYSGLRCGPSSQWAINWTVGGAVEWFVERIRQRSMLDILDGTATDGLFGRLNAFYIMWYTQVDFNNNGIADRYEMTREEFANLYNSGVKRLKSKMRNMLGEKLMVINSGIWFQDHSDKWTENGAIVEYYGPTSNYEWEWGQYRHFMETAREPQATLFLAQPKSEDPCCSDDSKNYFRFMRFTLAKVLMGNGYYHFEPAKLLNVAEHYYTCWFDEFDLDIGMPITEPAEIEDGIWKREFEKGVVLLNINSHPVTLVSGELHKFRGSQCPAVNNGQPVDTLVLQGHSFLDWGKVEQTVGDGIILMREPTTCISDIIIDNQSDFTSPGQEPIQFEGDWKQVAEIGGGYALRVDANHKMYSHAEGTGSYLCIPKISVPGNYQVFEWDEGWKLIGTEYLDGNNYGIGGNGGRADAYMFRYVEPCAFDWEAFYQWLSIILLTIGG